MVRNIINKAVGAAGSASGATGILGSWQVCHGICLGVISLLGALGIAVAGMPFMFLVELAVPMWTAAFLLLLVSIGIYAKKKCISAWLIAFNSGLVVAGIPFKQVQEFSGIFWVVGGVLALTGIFIFLKSKLGRGERKNGKKIRWRKK